MSGTEQQPSRAPARSESRLETAGRMTRRTWLYTWATTLVLVLIAIVVLVVQNTRSVSVGYIFGRGNISLVYLVLASAILGWVLGIATALVFHRRTRRGH